MHMLSDVKVSVLRNSEVATVFWDSAREKMFDPSTQDFWVCASVYQNDTLNIFTVPL